MLERTAVDLEQRGPGRDREGLHDDVRACAPEPVADLVVEPLAVGLTSQDLLIAQGGKPL